MTRKTIRMTIAVLALGVLLAGCVDSLPKGGFFQLEEEGTVGTWRAVTINDDEFYNGINVTELNVTVTINENGTGTFVGFGVERDFTVDIAGSQMTLNFSDSNETTFNYTITDNEMYWDYGDEPSGDVRTITFIRSE